MFNGKRTATFRGAVLSAVLLALALLGALFVSPGAADASGVTYNLVKTSYFTGRPAVGYHQCQQRTVTLPKLASTERYVFAETFSTDTLQNFHQTFHGRFNWSVCVFSMKGRSASWTYVEYSMLTLVNSACEYYGHCTTYRLQNHYISWDGGSNLWGSQIYIRPATYCNVVSCVLTEGSVTKTTS